MGGWVRSSLHYQPSPTINHEAPHVSVPVGVTPSHDTFRLTRTIQETRQTVANIKSQKKRNLTNEKRRQRNQAVKSELKTYVRKVREAIAAGDKDTADTALRAAGRKLDKAVSKGVIHKNQAANRKSKLAKQVAGL